VDMCRHTDIHTHTPLTDSKLGACIAVRGRAENKFRAGRLANAVDGRA
jgi:hypothetical protein